MVCTAKDFLGWKDFPKGLRVLLLDKNSTSADEIRSKLEEMDYIVSTFYNENEALTAISNNSEGFHVAIVEVSTGNSDGRFKFLEHAKDLPTIMTSDMHCLSTMMKCIVLGAVEFVRKPLSKDKLRNIWQHVVHKALNSVGKGLSESMQPVKESMVSMLQLKLENGEPEIQISVETENVTRIYKNTAEQSAGSDKYPASSTLQIEQGVKLLDERERLEQDGESKSVETTCGNSGTETTFQAAGSEDECNISSCFPSKDCTNKCGGDARMLNEASSLHNSCGSKANRKKMKIDWTPELHKKFVQSVEQLGVDQAIPSCILELMKVDGLTRHNVASHLQKYRMQRRHILPKGNYRRWPNPRESMQRNCYSHKPVMAFPPDSLVYPAWVPPSSYGANVQRWGPPCYPAWQSTESWHWKPYTGMYADAWGCPMMPPPPCPSIPQILQNASRFQSAADTTRNSYSMPQNSSDLHPAEEVIDKVVREAISKPWLPLPLGLKPPSAESVLTELSKQGLSTFPRRPH